MDRRLLNFMIVALAVWMLNVMLMRWLMPPQPQPQPQPDAAQQARIEPPDAAARPDVQPADAPPDAPPPALVARKEFPEQWFTLGSGDPDSPYRMLVTLTNRGAAVARIELNGQQYLDQETLEPRGGYLGHLAETDDPDGRGVLVRIVGPGTPADRAGLKAGDVITLLDGLSVDSAAAFRARMIETRPRSTLELLVLRDGKTHKLSIALTRFPLEVVHPEQTDPLSFLLTMQQLDDQKLPVEQTELAGLDMRSGNWEVVQSDADDELVFRWIVVDRQLEVTRRYRIARVPDDKRDDADHPSFHLHMDVELRNLGQQPLVAAYRLDGPTGLPTEGWWYALHSKISPNFRGGAGMRDVVTGYLDGQIWRPKLVSCESIIDNPNVTVLEDTPLLYLGVDAQYFASVLIPQTAQRENSWIERSIGIRVGPVPAESGRRKLTNISCRLLSRPATLEPGGHLVHQYQVFAGPKRPALLAHYADPLTLDNLVQYGWFWWVAKPLLRILHFFSWLTGSYGLAIILLTVLVRSAMFPISRKQALNAQKMQELQPEIKRIADKYKNNLEARSKAQQELFRKHNYNPLSGCLPMFLQLPIFIGLYRLLSVDVELRQAPLLTTSIGWASNLAAPDMFWRWDGLLPAFLAGPTGWLGPYLNLLPCVTIVLFIWQQKMFMPPPTDDQAAMQQKIMRYMMVVIGFLFFKVAAGLCVYFIASSLWGIAERLLLPKTVAAGTAQPAATGEGRKLSLTAQGEPNGRQSGRGEKKRQRGRR